MVPSAGQLADACITGPRPSNDPVRKYAQPLTQHPPVLHAGGLVKLPRPDPLDVLLIHVGEGIGGHRSSFRPRPGCAGMSLALLSRAPVRRSGRCDLLQLGAVPDGGWVADSEQVGEPERVAAAGECFIVEPGGAEVPCGDFGLAHGGLDVAAVHGGPPPVLRLISRCWLAVAGPARVPGLQPCVQVPGGEPVQRPGAAADEPVPAAGSALSRVRARMSLDAARAPRPAAR